MRKALLITIASTLYKKFACSALLLNTTIASNIFNKIFACGDFLSLQFQVLYRVDLIFACGAISIIITFQVDFLKFSPVPLFLSLQQVDFLKFSLAAPFLLLKLQLQIFLNVRLRRASYNLQVDVIKFVSHSNFKYTL